jgi:hypothetical protein
MSNSFWNFVTQFVPGGLAKAEEVNTNLSGVAAGLDLVEAELVKSLQVTNAAGVTDIVLNAAARAGKLISFDINGDLAATTIMGDWKGDHADSEGTDYQIRDVVRDSQGDIDLASLYICIETHTSTGNILADTAKWELLLASSTNIAENVTLDNTGLIVVDETNVKDWILGADGALLKARGTGVTSTYVNTATPGGTTFDQAAVNGEMSSDEGYASFSYAGATGVTVSDLTATSTYVYIDKNGDLGQQTTIPTRQDKTRKSFTMRIGVNTVTETIIGFEYYNNPIGHYTNTMRDIYEYLRAAGVSFRKEQLITGRADLGFDVSAGSLLELGGTGNIFNPNEKPFDAATNVSYNLMSRTAFVSAETNLQKVWDNAETITALGSTTFVGHRLYRFSSGNFAMQYGQGNYANLLLAKSGVLTEEYVLNPALKDATFFGWWIVSLEATTTNGTTQTSFREYTIGLQGGSSSSLSGAVLRGNNASDFLDYDVVRTNLGLSNVVKHVANVTALRALTGFSVGDLFHLEGHTNANIGGGPLLCTKAHGSEVDNNGTLFVVGGFVIERQSSDSYSILDFGAIPDWDGTTGTDNSASILSCITSVSHTVIPRNMQFATSLAGSVFLQSLSDKKISGGGQLFKTGARGVFSFSLCNNIHIEDVYFDCRRATDEAASGNILDGSRSSVDYAFAVSFANSSNCSIKYCTAIESAQDGFVAQGTVDTGGLTATLSTEIRFLNNNLKNIRGSSNWIRAISGFDISHNKFSNDVAFQQKANHIFIVEWNSEGVVSNNRSFFCGDNAIGIGEMVNGVVEARNDSIAVHDNVIKGTRYHSILVAQGNNIDVHDNIIENSGDKDRFPSPSVVLTGGILLLGGTGGGVTAPRNSRISVRGNKIYNAFEWGILVLDRAGTTTHSDNITIQGNTVANSGKQTQASRISSGGIFTQTRDAVLIQGNKIDFCTGSGIEWFGDSICQDNQITTVTGYGISAPQDTVFLNDLLSGAVSGNTVINSDLSGIKIATRLRVDLYGNKAIGCGSAGAAETIADVVENSGIAVYNTSRVNHSNNEVNDNQGCGIVTSLVSIVHGSLGHANNNGAGYTTADFKSGYLHSQTPAQTIVKVHLLQGSPGTNQTQFITVLNPSVAGCVALDTSVSAHTLDFDGITAKSSLDIP